MANSPSFCRQYLTTLLGPVLDSDTSLVHVYMDDIILEHRDPTHLKGLLTQILTIFSKEGFTVTLNKVQKVSPFKILSSHLTLTQASPFKPLMDIPKGQLNLDFKNSGVN